jgi:branched-subunit amino acid transport protein
VNIWLVMLASGFLTYLTRLSFIALFSKMAMPGWLGGALRFVPPAVLSAIIFPELFLVGGQLDLTPGNTRLIAGLMAVAVSLWKRSVLLTILVGMGVLLLLEVF